jgi:hypothetical protein
LTSYVTHLIIPAFPFNPFAIMRTRLSKLTRNNTAFRRTLTDNPVQQIVDGHGRDLFIVVKGVDSLVTAFTANDLT